MLYTCSMPYEVTLTGDAVGKRVFAKVDSWLEVRAVVAVAIEEMVADLPSGRRDQAYAVDVMQINFYTVGDPCTFKYDCQLFSATLDVKMV